MAQRSPFPAKVRSSTFAFAFFNHTLLSFYPLFSRNVPSPAPCPFHLLYVLNHWLNTLTPLFLLCSVKICTWIITICVYFSFALFSSPQATLIIFSFSLTSHSLPSCTLLPYFFFFPLLWHPHLCCIPFSSLFLCTSINFGIWTSGVVMFGDRSSRVKSRNRVMMLPVLNAYPSLNKWVRNKISIYFSQKWFKTADKAVCDLPLFLKYFGIPKKENIGELSLFSYKSGKRKWSEWRRPYECLMRKSVVHRVLTACMAHTPTHPTHKFKKL